MRDDFSQFTRSPSSSISLLKMGLKESTGTCHEKPIIYVMENMNTLTMEKGHNDCYQLGEDPQGVLEANWKYIVLIHPVPIRKT